MHRLSLVLILGAIMSCSMPPSSPIGRVQIIPSGPNNWYVGWSQVARAEVDGMPVDTTRPLILAGDREHVIVHGSKRLKIPIRNTETCRTTRLVLLGDGRASIDGLGPSAYWPGILREAYEEKPELVLNSGDLVKNGNVATEWNQFLRQTPEQPPMVVVRGNHDRGPIFDELQLVPGPVFWFRVGPVLVVGIDSEISMNLLPRILKELDEILSRERAQWRILIMHRPIWSRGNHGSDERGWNDRWVPLIDRHGVDLVLGGHDHNYERFCRQTGLGSTRACHDDHGTVYVVSGGAATFTNPIPGIARDVPPVTKETDKEMSRVFSGSQHYVVLDFSPTHLAIRAQRTRTGNSQPRGIIDTVTLTKENDRCP